MKIAVTGANGFVGREVLRQASEAGHTVVPLVRNACGLPGEIVTGYLHQSSLSASDLAGCEAVIHLAARTHVMNDTADDPMGEYRRTNVDGTKTILELAIAAGVSRFVFMSSIKAIGERSRPGAPLEPDAAPQPEDTYGKSKLEAERLVRKQCEAASISWVILRPPLVYGPGVKANFERLVDWIRRGVPLPFGSIENRRSLVDVQNLADATLLAATHPDAPGKAFMVADVTLSTPDLARKIGTAVKRPARLISVPTALLRLAGAIAGKREMIERLCGTLELDVTRTMTVLGWRPRRSFESSLSEIDAHSDISRREKV